jgi:hypothetical protein
VVAVSEIVEGRSRIFLESTRFDRVGARGRKGCLTFSSIESEVEDEKVRLAPIYDMLPMFFAPKESEEGESRRDWEEPRANPDTLPYWEKARAAARVFWERVCDDSRISADFKRVAAERMRS